MQTDVEPHLGAKEVSVLNRLVKMIFGEDVYCAHGTKGSDGVCIDCCNDLYEPSNDDYAEVIDFPALRDTM